MAKPKQKKRPRPTPQNTIQTKISDRKAKRKEERKSKKKKPRIHENGFDEWTQFREEEIEKEEEVTLTSKPASTRTPSSTDKPESKKIKAKEPSLKKKKQKHANDYDAFDTETAAAMAKDDEEIAMLGKKLGIGKSEKDKKKLNKEYAKLEGYGDDFGDFLDGLDNMMDNITGEGEKEYDDDVEGLQYDSDESDPAAARARYLLKTEHMKGENSHDSMEEDDSDSDGEDLGDDSDSDGEEMVPMKGPEAEDASDEEASSSDGNDDKDDDSVEEEADPSDESDGDEDSDDDSESEVARDHDAKYTYQPISGQDLYGNVIDNDGSKSKEPTKYVPPHLRKQQAEQLAATPKQAQDDDDPERKEKLRAIQRLLNNNLNRLSDNTLESVAKSIASIYRSSEYSSRDVNEKFWKNMRAALVASHMIMSNLIPIYMACVSGVHFQAGDSVQLGGFVIENVVLELWAELKKNRGNSAASKSSSLHDDNNPIHSSKEASNLMMIICYLYNYNVVHCSLMYDIVRELIKSFTEIDVELLLLILSHGGSQLRSDDPTALKDIVLLVQERSMEVITLNKSDQGNGDAVATSSRAQFMISAITDLKNNKRRNADIAISEKTTHYRRAVGRMKSALSSGPGRVGESSSLRLTVQDILDIETRGRWWVVGATWIGNQQRPDDDRHEKHSVERMGSNPKDKQKSTKADAKHEKLLALAAKQRMNTDLRRSVFCIIMGSDDCQDAFEKLVRGGLLKGKADRDVVRVLVHCCGQEKVYNPYYAHLANRICEHQNKSKFTFQLAFWDCFKQFEDMKARKAANLAKLLAHLMTNSQLNLNVLKTIDISPDDMPEAAIIFLTILFSNIFEAYDDPAAVMGIFQRGKQSKEQLLKKANDDIDNDDVFAGGGREALKENLSIFLMHYLENSPKNVKKSNFRTNLKAAIKACEEDSFDSMM